MALDPGAQTPPQSPSPRRHRLDQPLVRLILAAALLAILGGVALYVRSTGGSDEPARAVATLPAGQTPQSDADLGPLDSASPVLGSPAPDFALRTADGTVAKLSDYRGQVVSINFWATWCVPCKKELPDIQALYDELGDKGLAVLTVNYQDSTADAQDFFAQRGLTMPILMDRGSVYDAYRLNGLPDSFFVDRDGVLRAQQFGSFTQDTMRERLAAAGLQ